MVQKMRCTLLAAISLLALSVNAQVLFEGYSKVLSGGVPIGYSISRYEFDNKKKEFIATTFLKTNELGGNITESVKARANVKFQPISYSYNTAVGAKTKSIDATFKNNKMNATITDDGKVEKVSRDLPKDTILSAFVAYATLDRKENSKPYTYPAVAEEDAVVYNFTTTKMSSEDYKGIKVSKVRSEFKNTEFVSYVTDKGEVLATKSPAQSIGTELVASPEEATKNFPVSNQTLSLLFGSVPLGKDNTLVQHKNAAPLPDPKSSNKFTGVPPNKGIYVKGKPLPTNSANESEVKSTPETTEKKEP